MEAVTSGITVGKHDLSSSWEPGSGKAVVAFHEQGGNRTGMSGGTFAIDRVGYVGLVTSAVDVLAIPTRREVDLHTNGVTLRVLFEVGECGSLGGAANVGAKMGNMRIEGVAARSSEGVPSRHSIHTTRALVLVR